MIIITNKSTYVTHLTLVHPTLLLLLHDAETCDLFNVHSIDKYSYRLPKCCRSYRLSLEKDLLWALPALLGSWSTHIAIKFNIFVKLLHLKNILFSLNQGLARIKAF